MWKWTRGVNIGHFFSFVSCYFINLLKKNWEITVCINIEQGIHGLIQWKCQLTIQINKCSFSPCKQMRKCYISIRIYVVCIQFFNITQSGNKNRMCTHISTCGDDDDRYTNPFGVNIHGSINDSKWIFEFHLRNNLKINAQVRQK